jgi:hypothetical protein
VSRLLIVVPTSRRACGRATFVARDGRALLPPMRILATASRAVAKKHGNPTRDRSLPFGHPPSGGYLFTGSLPPGYRPKPRRANQKRAERFGVGGAILLAASSGEALAAAQKNGRRLFYLHGGPPDRKGRLRPTRGGFRLLDRDLTALLRAINDAHASGDPLELVEVVDVAVAASDQPTDPADQTASRRRMRKRKKKRRAERAKKKTGALQLPSSNSGGGGAPLKLSGIPAIAPLIVLAAKLLGNQSTDPRAPVSRRSVMALALLLVTVAGCSDEVSHCEPVACDPNDASCPREPLNCDPSYPSCPRARLVIACDPNKTSCPPPPSEPLDCDPRVALCPPSEPDVRLPVLCDPSCPRKPTRMVCHDRRGGYGGGGGGGGVGIGLGDGTSDDSGGDG